MFQSKSKEKRLKIRYEDNTDNEDTDNEVSLQESLITLPLSPLSLSFSLLFQGESI